MKSQCHCEIERKSRAGGPWWFIYVMTFKHNSAFNIIAIFRTVASKLHITCQNCKWMHLFWTSKRKQKSFGSKSTTSVWNVKDWQRSPPRPKSFKKSSCVIAKHAKTVAKNSMKAAAKKCVFCSKMKM